MDPYSAEVVDYNANSSLLCSTIFSSSWIRKAYHSAGSWAYFHSLKDVIISRCPTFPHSQNPCVTLRSERLLYHYSSRKRHEKSGSILQKMPGYPNLGDYSTNLLFKLIIPGAMRLWYPYLGEVSPGLQVCSSSGRKHFWITLSLKLPAQFRSCKMCHG